MSKEEKFPTYTTNILYFGYHAAERFIERFNKKGKGEISIENYIQYLEVLLNSLREKTYVCSLLGKYNKVRPNDILTKYDIRFSVIINGWKIGLAGFYYPSYTAVCITTIAYVLKINSKQSNENSNSSKSKKEKNKIGNIALHFSKNLKVIPGCPKYPFTQNKESCKKQRNHRHTHKRKAPNLEDILARSTLLGAVLRSKIK